MKTPKKWMNPYPKWTNFQRMWAEKWLIALALFISLGLLFTYSRGPDGIRFSNFPNAERQYSKAFTAAL